MIQAYFWHFGITTVCRLRRLFSIMKWRKRKSKAVVAYFSKVFPGGTEQNHSKVSKSGCWNPNTHQFERPCQISLQTSLEILVNRKET
jgi:hypothetical protein